MLRMKGIRVRVRCAHRHRLLTIPTAVQSLERSTPGRAPAITPMRSARRNGTKARGTPIAAQSVRFSKPRGRRKGSRNDASSESDTSLAETPTRAKNGRKRANTDANDNVPGSSKRMKKDLDATPHSPSAVPSSSKQGKDPPPATPSFDAASFGLQRWMPDEHCLAITEMDIFVDLMNALRSSLSPTTFFVRMPSPELAEASEKIAGLRVSEQPCFCEREYS